MTATPIADLSREQLLARYAGVLSHCNSLPTHAALAREIRAQGCGDVRKEAIGLLLLEKYEGIGRLAECVTGAFIFEVETIEELDRYAKSILQADELAARVIEELRAAGFVIQSVTR